jgi:CheY-like chemotaxis protein
VAVNRELVRTMLKQLGHSFEEAEDGATAVRAAMEQRFDLILMDMQMPLMDGLSATRAIRASPNPNMRTPIIALTANVLAPQIAACHDAGMNDHIAKPISPRDLLEKVIRWCEMGLLEGDEETASQAAVSL